MADLVQMAEAAGLYVESHDSRKSAQDMLLYCTKCGRDLLVIKAGDLMFEQTHGKCTCSWACCAATTPEKHERHLAHKPLEA